MSIFIDKEMRALIPPLSEDELEQLEANILAEGIRDPLVTWPQPDGREMLIDGHNRFDIACRHCGIPFQVKRMDFQNKDEAKIWMIQNQLGKRNLTPYDRGVLELKKKEIFHGLSHQGCRTDLTSVQNWTKVDSLKTMAKNAGMSRSQIAKIQAIESKATPEQKQLVREGTMSINQAYNAVTNKTPKRAKEEYLDGLKERHEDFDDRKKTEKAVSLTEAMQDKQDQLMLALNVWNKMLRMGNQIDEVHSSIASGDYDIKNMVANINDHGIEELKTALSRWDKKLKLMLMDVTNK